MNETLPATPSPSVAEMASIADRPPTGMVICKFESRSVVGGVTLSDGGMAVLKYYFPKTLFKHLAYGITCCRCRRSWVAARAFRFAEVPTPLILRDFTNPGGSGINLSFLVTASATRISLTDFVVYNRDESARISVLAVLFRQLWKALPVVARSFENVFIRP